MHTCQIVLFAGLRLKYLELMPIFKGISTPMLISDHGWIQRGEGGPEIRNTGMDLPQEQWVQRSNCFSSEGCTALCEIG